MEGGKEADKVKFYTGLFHALLGRGLASDANGYYPKNDGTVGRIALDEKVDRCINTIIRMLFGEDFGT